MTNDRPQGWQVEDDVGGFDFWQGDGLVYDMKSLSVKLLRNFKIHLKIKYRTELERKTLHAPGRKEASENQSTKGLSQCCSCPGGRSRS